MYDTAIVGGGLAGLTTAALLARAGQRVLVLEKSKHIGGRARTTSRDGFDFNVGAHALYRSGHARRILDNLGVPYSGSTPPLGGIAVTDEDAYAFPVTPWSWLTTDLFTPSQRAELARQLIRLGAASASSWIGKALAEFLDGIGDLRVRQSIESLFRLTTYGNDPDRFDAGASIEQVQLALRNVLYLDGGWQTLVDGAADVARSHGAEIVARRVDSLDEIDARTIVIAASPTVAAKLTGSEALSRFADTSIPVRAACLDVALSSLPNPRPLALGLDRATYLSVHSASAKLAPEGGALIHALAYIKEGEERDPRAELEDLLDRVQPGWRELVVHQQYLPQMTVTHAMPAAATGGLAGRFDPEIPDRPGTFVVGDWVGSRGMLVDAALASAEQVAEHLLTRAREAA